ncbi:MAG: Phosphoglycerate kinase [Parcubacteria group bacterium ADurb.Bin316]|nr:MAG: Phosphoglycerate kinase [Parcubacteria group bacterium ADurb.Bin316]HOZ56260.1 phosphoglycerate kinase [bacterium]
MAIKTIKNAKNLYGKKVLLRTDLNVPIKKGKIQDNYKIEQQLATIKFLLDKHCRVVLITHLGRPVPGKYDEKYSVKPIAKALGKLIGKNIIVVEEINEFEAGKKISKAKYGDIIMLENVRFEVGEEKNNRSLAKNLAKLGEVYVNDAFAVSHRAHASVSAIKDYLPSYAGLLLEKEIVNLDKALHPQKPLITVIGGSKISTKITLARNLEKKSAHLLVGGALANNFLLACGYEVGKSMVDKESIAFAKKFKSKKIVLPVDVVVSNRASGGEVKVKRVNSVSKGDYIFDIGPETIRLYSHFIKKAATIIWNGPMGKFEEAHFKYGTMSIARVVASRSKGRAFGVVGGGETVEALQKTNMFEYVDWVSTGGGAMLAYLGKEEMPGLDGII